MILQDEFDEMLMILTMMSSRRLDVAKVLEMWVGFLQTLKEGLKDVDESEKKEVRVALTNISKVLSGEIQKLTLATGIPEEQMIHYSENPDNLITEKQKEIAALQNKSRAISLEISHLLKVSDKRTKDAPQPSKSQSPEKKGISKRERMRKREKWTRS